MSRDLHAVRLEEEAGGRIARVAISGKLEKEDYELFAPELERLIQQHGKIRLLVEFIEFEGWSTLAAWEDIKFDISHFSDIERLAILGESRWEKGMAIFCKPFTRAEVRYFERSDIDEADRWIREGVAEN